MKIVCDACQAKYSISDDKVQGKVFKIRCKKCSNIIVVRGGAQAAEPAPAPVQEKETRVYDYGYDGAGDPAAAAGDESVWHVVINQDQVGPMTAAEVQQRFAAGDIDADTYIWREGFADWLPISQVDTFADFVASGNTTSAADPRGGGNAVASMFGGGEEAGTVRSDPGDLFAAAGSSNRNQQPDDDGDLFGSKKSPAASAPAASSSQSADAGSKLRGERNENSVLFSLGNLAQLASDKPAPVNAAPSGGGMAGGTAGGEGSGLIDIRSMANAYLGGPGGNAKVATSSAIGSVDDLPVFGGGGFSEPAALMMPTPSSNRGNSKVMYALIGAVGLLAVAAVILVVVLMSGKKVAPTTVASNDKDHSADTRKGDEPDSGKSNAGATDDGSAKAATGDTGATGDSGSTTATGLTGTSDSETNKANPDPTPTPVKADPTPTPTKPEKHTTGGSKTHEPTVKPDKVEKPVKSDSGGGGCDEVNCVISGYEGACCAKYKKGGNAKPTTTTTSGGKSDLPDSLDRSAIADGVSKVKSRVMACGDKSSAKGTVKVSVKVTADGGISGVTVKDTPDASLGSCVANAMQKASFRKTQNGGSFSYPFVF